jgi:hypothetical protein
LPAPGTGAQGRPLRTPSAGYNGAIAVCHESPYGPT